MTLPVPLAALRDRPGMMLHPAGFDHVIAFLTGYDAATSGGFLAGFREWLVMRAGRGTNLAWQGLARELVGDPATRGDEAAVRDLFAVLEEFLAARDVHDGVHRIIVQHEAWLHQRDLCLPDCPLSFPPKRRKPIKGTRRAIRSRAPHSKARR
ncbi:MAG TPA: hypothetical protein VGD37_18770 [Kofleriaceae bacterium]